MVMEKVKITDAAGTVLTLDELRAPRATTTTTRATITATTKVTITATTKVTTTDLTRTRAAAR